MLYCRHCHSWLPDERFHPSAARVKRLQCRLCANAERRERRRKKRELAVRRCRVLVRDANTNVLLGEFDAVLRDNDRRLLARRTDGL